MAMHRTLLLHLAAFACAVLTTSLAFSQTNPAMPITHEVTVQMVQTTSADGSESATTLGTPSQRESIENEVNNIWAQCGIRVNFLPTINTYANDFVFDGRPADYSVATRPESHLGTILGLGISDGVADTSSDTVGVYFTGITPGFSSLPSNTVAGLARVDGNGLSLSVGSALTTFPAGRAVVAFVFAHELAHNLGLEHEPSGSANLLAATNAASNQLTQSQCATVFTDNFGADGYELLNPVPEPSSLGLLLAALAMTLLKMRRRDRA